MNLLDILAKIPLLLHEAHELMGQAEASGEAISSDDLATLKAREAELDGEIHTVRDRFKAKLARL